MVIIIEWSITIQCMLFEHKDNLLDISLICEIKRLHVEVENKIAEEIQQSTSFV